MTPPKHIGLIADVFGDQRTIPRSLFLYELGRRVEPGRATRLAAVQRSHRAKAFDRYGRLGDDAYRPRPHTSEQDIIVGQRRAARDIYANYVTYGFLEETIVDGVRTVSLTTKFDSWKERL